EMVGGLIEDEELRRPAPGEHAGESGTQELAPAQRARKLERGVGPEGEARQRRAAGVLVRLRIERHEIVADRESALEKAHLLVEHHERDEDARPPAPRRELARDQ